MKTSIHVTSAVVGALLLTAVGCTDLDDKVVGQPVDLAAGAAAGGDLTGLLNGVYAQVNGLSDQANTYALGEHASDEMMGPTRGTDWDDFGTWRRLHQHTWDATHNQIIATWNNLNTGVFRANELIAVASSNANILAEGRFLRAFFMYNVADLFGKVPFREANASFDANPRVLTRAEATQFIIDDLNAAIAALPATGDPGRANKNSARFLLAKVLLNKAVFTQSPEQPAGPYTFTPADMNAVIANCDAIIGSGAFSLTTSGKYFDNFHWENSTLSKELIFVITNEVGASQGSAQNRYRMTLHYNQTPGGWNGFTTLADFYNSFEAGDQRRGAAITGLTNRTGLRAGFLVGQQNDQTGKALTDRAGAPLVYSPNLNLLYSDEKAGIRVIKYLPNPENTDNPGNDYVLFRYADVLLMKAEAILRGGTPTGGATALSLVNQIRTARGATPFTTVNEANLLAERGRELYWEGWRRNDMIRFGTFTAPFDQKPNTTPDHRVVYPIPQQAVDTNPNLTQNFGY